MTCSSGAEGPKQTFWGPGEVWNKRSETAPLQQYQPRHGPESSHVTWWKDLKRIVTKEGYTFVGVDIFTRNVALSNEGKLNSTVRM